MPNKLDADTVRAGNATDLVLKHDGYVSASFREAINNKKKGEDLVDIISMIAGKEKQGQWQRLACQDQMTHLSGFLYSGEIALRFHFYSVFPGDFVPGHLFCLFAGRSGC